MTRLFFFILIQILYFGFAFADLNKKLPEAAIAHTFEPQYTMLLNDGIGSLQKRLLMIESAQKSIDIEYYIYRTDQVGRLITQALARKAKQGVKIRLLVDRGLGQTNITEYDAALLIQNGIQVRFYNPANILDLKKANHRSHRKSLIVDGKKIITGGRNIADAYFEFSREHNLLDRDIYIEGSIVSAAQESFEFFWNSKLTTEALIVKEPQFFDFELSGETRWSTLSEQQYQLALTNYRLGLQNAKNVLFESKADKKNLHRIHLYGNKLLKEAPMSFCSDSYWYADLPGLSEENRIVYPQIKNLTEQAQQSISVESAFFIQIEKDDIFKKALSRGIKTEVLSNSFISTENVLTIAPFLRIAKKLGDVGGKLFVFDGTSPRWTTHGSDEANATIWGTHAKSIVIDEQTVVVGSFNMDPRSAAWNSEMTFVCKNNSILAQGLLLDIEKRKSISVQIDADGNPLNGDDKYFQISKSAKRKFFLTRPFTYLFESLM